ncbi:MAG: hypothetical protein QUV05_23990 [Phycisphaerae bacterium]|nr:hypothetical protein [Phycisphaerae bacterium]
MKTAVSTLTAWLIAAPCCAATLAAPSAAALRESLLAPPQGEGPVAVRAAFYLQDINAIDEEAETFQFSGVLTLVWRDPRQAFDPAAAGAGEKVYTGGYQFDEISPAWYPQVMLANVSGMYNKHAVLLRIKPDGTCTLIETVNAAAEAKLDLRRCPFDSQRLEVVFEVVGFDTSEIMLEAEPMPADVDGRGIRIPQWTVTGMGVSVRNLRAPYAGGQGNSSSFVLAIEVRRQSWFLLRLVVMPLMLVVVLSWSVFWMDQSSLGDRLSVSFVGILTAVAYLMVVTDKLPHISYVTLVHSLVTLSFLLMCASVLVSLVVEACDKKGNSALGNRIDRCCRWAFPLVYAGLISGTAVIATTWF